MRKFAVELIGTFFLVFTVAAASRTGSVITPIAVGAVLMVMVYAGGHISGAHYNPAVTLAVLIRGRIGIFDAVGYWISQLLGGLAGALIARATVKLPSTIVSPPLKGGGAALLVEILFTFALAYVVLNVATSDDHPDNNFYGLAIGFTVMAGAIAVGGVSGGAFNLAVALGGSTIGLLSWSSIWIYLVANIIGGVAAGWVFRAVNTDEKRSTAKAPQPVTADSR